MVPLFLNRVFRLFRYFAWFGLGLLWAIGLPVLAQTNGLDIYWHEGPQQVEIGDRLATLDLPHGYLFAAAQDAQAILRYIGNPTNDRDVGLVMSADEQETWMVVYSYDRIGYVQDTNVQKIDPAVLLPEIQAATTQDNQLRTEKGIPALAVTGWYQTPEYDNQHHQLSWGVTAQDPAGRIVNYNIRKFGRYGVTAINLVADQADLSSLQPLLDWLTTGYRYLEGQQYGDFVSGKDPIANLDLAMLVAGSREINSSARTSSSSPSGGVMTWVWLLLVLIGLGLSLGFGWARYQLYRHTQAAANSFATLPVVDSSGQSNDSLPLTPPERLTSSQESRQTRHSEN